MAHPFFPDNIDEAIKRVNNGTSTPIDHNYLEKEMDLGKYIRTKLHKLVGETIMYICEVSKDGKCLEVINNLEKILAVELLHSAQALEFRRPNKFSSAIEKTLTLVRKNVKKLKQDRILSNDIETITLLIEDKAFNVYPEL